MINTRMTILLCQILRNLKIVEWKRKTLIHSFRHIRDMAMIEIRHPLMAQEFTNGHFAMHKTEKNVSVIAIDQVHDQTNKIIKGFFGFQSVNVRKTFKCALNSREKRPPKRLTAPQKRQLAAPALPLRLRLQKTAPGFRKRRGWLPMLENVCPGSKGQPQEPPACGGSRVVAPRKRLPGAVHGPRNGLSGRHCMADLFLL